MPAGDAPSHAAWRAPRRSWALSRAEPPHHRLPRFRPFEGEVLACKLRRSRTVLLAAVTLAGCGGGGDANTLRVAPKAPTARSATRAPTASSRLRLTSGASRRAKLGKNVEFVSDAWDSIVAGWGQRFEPGRQPVTINDERKAKYDLSEALHRLRGVIVTRADNTDIISLADLRA